MFELLLFLIAFIGSLACGLYDLKTSNVPDSVCLLMIASGFIIHIVYGFSTGDFANLVNSLLFGGLFLGFGLLMYFTGQWGGGDGELLVTIGVLLPTMTSVSTIFPFSISFFVNSFFIGAIYSIIYSLILVCRTPKISKKFVSNMKSSKVLFACVVVAAFSTIFLFFSQPAFFAITILLLVLIVFQRFSKTIEESFYRRIPTKKLQVDDMLGEDIPKLRLYKRYIKGLSQKQVDRIRKHKRYVIVRDGIRYGLVFPLSLLFTYFIGDFLLFFV
ncbi:MAG: prepilin peptidase [Candidatus Aenigmarchaeota archaeon]|nr:prepilin peptidase [Candidatus Aenigmarchaeota archaeon]